MDGQRRKARLNRKAKVLVNSVHWENKTNK